MRALILAALPALLLAAPAEAKPTQAKPTQSKPARPVEVVGVIAAFDCGDNCYLTIKKADGEDVYALCHAPQCAPWVEEQAIPKQMIGRKVTATLGKGKQTDGAGTVMGEMEAFTKLKFGR
jgi:hypothetical protein